MKNGLMSPSTPRLKTYILENFKDRKKEIARVIPETLEENHTALVMYINDYLAKIFIVRPVSCFIHRLILLPLRR